MLSSFTPLKSTNTLLFFFYKIQMNRQRTFPTITTQMTKMWRVNSNSQKPVWADQKILSQVYAESIFIIQVAGAGLLHRKHYETSI